MGDGWWPSTLRNLKSDAEGSGVGGEVCGGRCVEVGFLQPPLSSRIQAE